MALLSLLLGKYRLPLWGAVFLINILLNGCSNNTGIVLQGADIEALNTQAKVDAYILGEGDTIAIKFFFNDKLNEEVTIRPDGYISLQLLGEIKAAGLTPAQLASLLTKKYTNIIENFSDLEVTVNVKEFASQRVYVGGEVANPSQIPLKGLLRSLEAITIAGGPRDTANLDKVILIRYQNAQKAEVYSLNINSIVKGELPDVTLKSYDIVYVPKTAIAKVDLFVEQYLHRILPRQLLFPYNLNPVVVLKEK